MCEILGVLCGLLLILYTRRKWLYTGLFNVIAGLIAYSAWLIPLDRKLHSFPLKPFNSSFILTIYLILSSSFTFSVETDLLVTLFMCSSMVSKIAISSTLAILTTCTTELVCGEKKKICGFSTIVYARVWLLCAPFIGATIVYGQLIPQTALATLSIIGGVLSSLISSPQTISAPVKHSNFPKEIYPEIYTIKNFDSLNTAEKFKA